MTDSVPAGTTRIVCCQLAPLVADPDRNADVVEPAITAAVQAGADVIVLPEAVTSGYPFVSMDEARAASISRNDPLFERWGRLAGDAVLVFGIAELGPDPGRSSGLVYNTAVPIDAGGPPVFYRKTHLWDTEKLFFTPGDEPPPVLDTHVGRIAIMVCYDMEFPEMTRSVALRGADLLTVPTNWPYVERPAGWPAPEVVIVMAAARVNRLPIACCDRTGADRGQRWNEESTIIGADGWQLATADGGHVVTADVDLGAARVKAISTRNDVHADRRPPVYG